MGSLRSDITLITRSPHRRVRRWCSVVAGAVLGAVLLTAPPASAQLTLDIFNPDRIASPNSTNTFSGTIRNDTGQPLDAAADLFLNFNGFDSTVVTLTQLLGTPDFPLPDGTTSPPVDLFSFMLGPGALAGHTYFADVTVEDTFNDISNVVTVSETVPEPGTLLLLGAGLAASALGYSTRGSRRRR
jgi:hypothetical protein